MSTANSYLRRPITTHRRTSTVLFKFAKRRRHGTLIVYRPGQVCKFLRQIPPVFESKRHG